MPQLFMLPGLVGSIYGMELSATISIYSFIDYYFMTNEDKAQYNEGLFISGEGWLK